MFRLRIGRLTAGSALWVISAFLPSDILAQNYHAVEGSPFAGSIGVANNPASILSTPYPWDITVLSVQVKNSTNAVTFHNFSLLSHGDSIWSSFDAGNRKRFAAFNFNVHLLNARIALGRKQAIAFGANLRGYAAVRTGVANYNDSLQDMNQFFAINQGTDYNANMVSSSWLELFGTYSRTLWDDNTSRLNAGVTLKAMRGISGAFAQLKSGAVGRTTSGLETVYVLKAGSARYGYSSNYDRWKDEQSTGQNLKDFLGASRPGAAIDLGVEYWIKSQAVKTYSDEDNDDYYDYEWKIGVSLLDIGQNSFKFGTQSRSASSPRTDVSDFDLNAKFNNTASLADFNDSLATIVNNISGLNGTFKIWNPTRLVINVDRPLQDKFFLNANLSVNLARANTGKTLFAKEMNLLTLTPRWETRRLGVYMPVQVTSYGKFWIGGAFKAGPLLLGVHNWTTLFSKNKMQNGGLYLGLVIRPGKKGVSDKVDKRYDCPKESRY